MKKLPMPLKVAVASLGGLVVAIGVVVITASAVGFDLTGAVHGAPAAAATPTPAPAASATPSRAQANPATRAVTLAVAQAEAQALGLQPRDLAASVRRGATPHQLATQKGITPAAFQATYQKDLTALLSQDVQQGTLTQQQEQAALRRLGSRLPPNWDGAAARATPSPSPRTG